MEKKGTREEKDDREIKILAFLCNWCSYAGADLAGVSRLQYPAKVLSVRVMCTGTISPYFVIKALQEGIDGVLIAGCHIGDCHYLKGNYMAKKRFEFLRDALPILGLEPERLRLEWISAAEGEKFAAVIRGYTAEIEKLGPSPLHRYQEEARG